jgi:hypothetical protein
MTESTDGSSAEANGDSDYDDAVERLEDVDHTHPDTGESFTETGVYDRGKDRNSDADS